MAVLSVPSYARFACNSQAFGGALAALPCSPNSLLLTVQNWTHSVIICVNDTCRCSSILYSYVATHRTKLIHSSIQLHVATRRTKLNLDVYGNDLPPRGGLVRPCVRAICGPLFGGALAPVPCSPNSCAKSAAVAPHRTKLELGILLLCEVQLPLLLAVQKLELGILLTCEASYRCSSP